MIRDQIIMLLAEHKEEVLKFQVKALSLFGSVARGEEKKNSDVDMIVEFIHLPSFDLYMDLKFFLEDLIGRKVDLITTTGVREEVRKYIQKDLIRVA